MKTPDDLHPSAATSALMRRIRGKDTGPELRVRAILRDLGHTGYRLHRRDLPGRPDIAFIGRKIAIFVHGCYWHQHGCGQGTRLPKKNSGFWAEKFARNAARDRAKLLELERLGWRVAVIWECELRDAAASVKARLSRLLAGD